MTNTMPVNPPPYVTSMDEMFWGAILVVVSLTMHGFGMLGTLRFSESYKGRFGSSCSFAIGKAHRILASWMITLSHILEVMMWAGFFQWKHCFVN